MFVSFSFSVYIINRKKKEEVSRPGFGLVMNFFFNTLIHNEFFFFEYALVCYFFSPSSILQELFFVWMGLKK